MFVHAQLRGFLPLPLASVLVSGCAREPEPLVCPDAEEGELVISEVRGAQSSTDTWGQWVELYNASGSDIDIHGLRVTFVPGDGSEPDVVLVRTEPVEVPLGEYVVLGREDDIRRSPHVDYGYLLDFAGDIPPVGKIEVQACGVVVDSATYRDLPQIGTLALDGEIEPTAEANDDMASWCGDTTEPPLEGPQTEIGVPGTPGEENRPCP